MQLVQCTCSRHASSILDIFNDAILHSTALYEYRPRNLDSITSWFASKQTNQYPVLGMESTSGELLGFASYGVFRDRPAYKYTVEHSVYVHRTHRGKGIGSMLLRELIASATSQQVHVLVGGIDAMNTGSIAMHIKLGFSHAGTIKQAGFKFGRWLDLAFYQLTLSTPIAPIDG